MRFEASRSVIARRALAISIFVSAGAGLFVACSSPTVESQPTARADASTGVDDASASAQAADSQAYADTVCVYYQRCAPGYLAVMFGDAAACRQELGALTKKKFGIQDANVIQAQLEACLNKLGVRSCADGPSALPECLFAGPRDNAASCVWGTQCKSGSCQTLTGPDGGATRCSACAVRVAVGGACSDIDGLYCAPGLNCVGKKCTPRKRVGERCGVNECESPLGCVLDSASAQEGTCTAPLQKDQDCFISGVFYPCDGTKNLTCAFGGKCVEPRYAAMGDPCGGSNPASCAGGICHESVCKPRPGNGEPCPEYSCALGFDCVAGTCIDGSSPECH